MMEPVLSLNFLGFVLLGIFAHQSEASNIVPCFSSFSQSTGKCGDLLGEVEKEKCCLNPNYGYTDENGVCQFCGLARWSDWSSWSECTVSCLEGVTQRRRFCYGKGSCTDFEKLGTIQAKPCEKKSCCPVHGGWSDWGNWEPCSVTCANGIKKRKRTCTNPPPQCDGSCIGKDEETNPCDTQVTCPTHGEWSSWGNWSPCPVTCIHEGDNSKKEVRKRTCTNPSPSIDPRGKDCEGSDTENRLCTSKPFCPVDGNWGSWSAPSPCSVTCGLGQQTQQRTCDSPQPKHGGKRCEGDAQKAELCEATPFVPCPVNGIWTEWSSWNECKESGGRTINCRKRYGTRRKTRKCVGRENNGTICDGLIYEYGDCFDIKNCPMKAVLSEWSEWSFCKPDCGPNSKQTRERKCIPDVSEYKSQDLRLFTGIPKMDCKSVKAESENRPCKNPPECET